MGRGAIFINGETVYYKNGIKYTPEKSTVPPAPVKVLAFYNIGYGYDDLYYIRELIPYALFYKKNDKYICCGKLRYTYTYRSFNETQLTSDERKLITEAGYTYEFDEKYNSSIPAELIKTFEYNPNELRQIKAGSWGFRRN